MENFDYTDEQIHRILKSHKQKMDREKKYYHDVSKNNEDFIRKNRERARKHYHNGYNEKKKLNYQDNKELIKMKSLYNYYKKKDNIDKFKDKYPEKYQKLIDINFIS